MIKNGNHYKIWKPFGQILRNLTQSTCLLDKNQNRLYNFVAHRRVVSSEVERFLDAEEVTGSSPVPPTTNIKGSGRVAGTLFRSLITG